MKCMKKKLPVYQLTIDVENDAIVSAISLVDEPAIESNFLAFSKQQKLEFKTNEELMELLGAAMISDQLIYRIDPETGEEFNVYFSADTIRQIAQQYFKMGFQNSMNINHTAIPAHSYIFQSYIVDKTKGMLAPKGIDVPNGSWIVGVKVTDKSVWDSIKQGKINGFSIEGLFQFIQGKFNKNNNDEDAEIMELLQQINQRIKNK